MQDEDDDLHSITPGKVIGQKFRLEDKIGQGSFGLIFKSIHIESNEQCAIKLEKRNQKHSSMLVREIKVMMEVKNEKGFAKLVGYGKDDEYNYVAMTYLGRNLDNLLKKCGGKYSLLCLLNLIDQMITRVEVLHSKNLIHRDIKPENFVIGYNQNFATVHLIDFGLAKYYKDADGNHIPWLDKKGMIGTARYASINAHQGFEQSRRDDLEGLGYVFIYFAKGKLPWQTIYAENKDEKYEIIKNMKMTYPIEQLCEGLPIEFQQYFKQVKQLGFQDTPNYANLKKLFKKVATDKKLDPNSTFVDWETLPEYKQKKKSQTNISVEHTNSQQKPNDDKNQKEVQQQQSKEAVAASVAAAAAAAQEANKIDSKKLITDDNAKLRKAKREDSTKKEIKDITEQRKNSTKQLSNLLQIPNNPSIQPGEPTATYSVATSRLNNYQSGGNSGQGGDDGSRKFSVDKFPSTSQLMIEFIHSSLKQLDVGSPLSKFDEEEKKLDKAFNKQITQPQKDTVIQNQNSGKDMTQQQKKKDVPIQNTSKQNTKQLPPKSEPKKQGTSQKQPETNGIKKSQPQTKNNIISENIIDSSTEKLHPKINKINISAYRVAYKKNGSIIKKQ